MNTLQAIAFILMISSPGLAATVGVEKINPIQLATIERPEKGLRYSRFIGCFFVEGENQIWTGVRPNKSGKCDSADKIKFDLVERSTTMTATTDDGDTRAETLDLTDAEYMEPAVNPADQKKYQFAVFPNRVTVKESVKGKVVTDSFCIVRAREVSPPAGQKAKKILLACDNCKTLKECFAGPPFQLTSAAGRIEDDGKSTVHAGEEPAQVGATHRSTTTN